MDIGCFLYSSVSQTPVKSEVADTAAPPLLPPGKGRNCPQSHWGSHWAPTCSCSSERPYPASSLHTLSVTSEHSSNTSLDHGPPTSRLSVNETQKHLCCHPDLESFVLRLSFPARLFSSTQLQPMSLLALLTQVP